VDVPVVLQDERLSSTEAESRLARREKDWRKRKQQLDAAAAAVILQDYLDNRPPTGPVMSESNDALD
jgi:putative Holliday junction resolvase